MKHSPETTTDRSLQLNPQAGSAAGYRWCVLPAFLLTLGLTLAEAQTTNSSASSADALAKYDKNANGRLDADELAAIEADKRARSKRIVVEDDRSNEDDPLELPVFEVKGDTAGYYAMNTMSGTRINSKVEDLASSMTVITLDQMDDFAMLDLNDIFEYEAGTEGMGTFTDFSVNNSGNPIDGNMADPTSANRVRGIGAANVSLGNFETSGRVPVDRIGIEGVEISRGPSSTIFGLGNPSGTVNMVAATGNLNRNKTQLQLRFDSDGGFRQHLDVNRVLIKNKLGFRFSQVYQETGYQLKPSGTKSQRYNFMLKYQPFKATTITASYQYYSLTGNRPNSITPRDGITPWVGRGSPTWDPLTARAYLNDQVAGTNMGLYGFTTAWQTTGRGSSLLFIDQDGVSNWIAPRGTTGSSPLTPDQNAYNYVILNPQTYRATQPLFTTDGAVNDKSLYDWSSINVAAMNTVKDETGTFLVQATQVILDTPKHMLAAQIGWFREDSARFQKLLNGKPASSGPTGGFLAVDVNRRMLDGSANPNYLRPYLAIGNDLVNDSPLLNDTYRGQLAYKLDFTRGSGWSKWLGLHQATGYYEYKDYERQNFNYKYAMVDNHKWLKAGTPRGTSASLYGSQPYNLASATGTRNYNFYYVGDAIGQNVDYAPGNINPGIYNYAWGDAATGEFNYESTQLGLAATLDGTGGTANVHKIQKTVGGVLQSHLLKGRVVTTLGLRRDRLYNKNGVIPQLLPDAVNHDFEWDNQWEENWRNNSGDTTSIGVVLKPFRWLNLYGNRSDSFLPADPAVNLQGNYLPNPTGEGKDFGLLFKLFDNTLTIRVNRYQNEQLNARSGVSSTIARAAARLDIWDDQSQARNFALSNQASQWIVAGPGGSSLTQEQLNARVAETMQMTPERIAILFDRSTALSETEDILARGTEVEFNYQPLQYWRMKLNVTEQESIQGNLSPGLINYLEERKEVWTSLIDPRTNTNWWTTQYNGVNSFTPLSYFTGNVQAPLEIAIAKEGKSVPQIRKYAVKYSTNFQLAAITDHSFFRALNISASYRWIDKGSIGYYGIADENGIYRKLDATRPIYDKARSYFDLGVGYKRKFRKKVGLNIQLTVKNIQEDGRLQPVSAFPDGTPNAYRIIGPRQFIFTSTFDF